MMKRKHIYPFFALALLLSSCFKNEDAIKLPVGSSIITSFYLGENYVKEVYFDLGTNSFQEKKLPDWDIRFESSKGAYGIFLNNGNNIIARKIDISGLTEISANDTNFFKTKKELVDPPEGLRDKSAIGDWRLYKSTPPDLLPGIYIIELSYASGVEKYKRLQVLGVNDSTYYIRVTNINQPSGDTIVIPKNANGNFTYYSFRNGGYIVANAEPDKNSWDIVFTKYKHVFYGILPGNEPYPYIVSGVLSNPYKVEIARDSAIGFNSIEEASIPFCNFTAKWNEIGYDWKTHAFGAAGTYTINTKLSYIIKDTEDKYYKLRFLDFYNDKGVKGYPKFEYVRIK